MKAKRLTALALAALMTASSTSVAFAETPTKDKPLTFYDGAIGEQLYMMDEDGYIVAANNGDFAPGDDIYLALQDYDAASKRELDRINAYEFLDIGDKWVDDIYVVYKKGTWFEQVAQTKVYNIDVTGLEISAFNNVTFSTNKTDSSTLVSLAKQALEAKRATAEEEVFVHYQTSKKGTVKLDGKECSSVEDALEAVYDMIHTYYTKNGTDNFKSLEAAGVEKKTQGYYNGTQFISSWQTLLENAGWTLYNDTSDGNRRIVGVGTGYGTILGDADAEVKDETTFAKWIQSESNLGEDYRLYLNAAKTRFVVIGGTGNLDISDEDLANWVSTDEKQYNTVTANNPQYIDANETLVTIEEKNNGYFDGDIFVGDLTAAKNKLITDGRLQEDTVTYYIVDGKEMLEAEARQAAKNTVTNAINSITADKVYTTSAYAGSPTGSYDGYVWNSGFAYWVKISTEKSTSTKEFDLVGEIGVGSTKSKAEDNTVFLDVTLTNRNWNEDSFENVDSDAYIEPGQRAVLSFADDADDVVIEFGDDAYYEFNARGQGRVNFAYNTNFDRDFAYDYDHANIDFINFVAEPTTNKTGTLYIYADEDSYIYEVTSKGAKKINGAYYDDDEGAWVIRTRHLTSYAISDRRLKTIDQMEDDKNSSSSSKPSGSQGSGSGNGNYKPIPDTGR